MNRRTLFAAAHKLWRLLPRSQRQAFFYRATALAAPRPSRSFGVGGPVTVAGLLSASTGLGEGARLNLTALQALGADTRAVDLAGAFDQSDIPVDPQRPQAPPPRPGEGGALIVHVNSPYLPFALWRLGRDAVRGRRVIGYWAWELPKAPPSWRAGLPFVHEIWAPSRFTADALAAMTSLPVRVAPHPLPPPAPSPLGRGDFGLPDDAFVVMTFFHMGSSFNRKNPLAAVAAFRAAFGDDPKAVLVLKAADADVAPWARRKLEEAIAGAGNIRIIDRKLPRGDLTALLATADVVLSLHRAEGFGLVPAQAMQLGRAVVATGWSGNLDFMDADTSILIDSRQIPAVDPQGTYDEPGQTWADPDVGQAAAALRALADDPERRRGLGARAALKAQTVFGVEAYRAAIEPSLGAEVFRPRR